MGAVFMAAFAVDTPLWLQPWAGAGVEYLLAPADLPAPWSLTLDVSRAAPPRPPRRAPARDDAPTPEGLRYLAERCRKNAAAHDSSYADEDNSAVRRAAPSGAQEQPHTAARAAGPAGHAGRTAAPTAAGRPAVQNARAAAGQGFAGAAGQHAAAVGRVSASPAEDVPPEEQWPPIWRERLRHAKAGRALWTYWSLGTDLCGTPDARRREFFRRLLTDLAHPAGTHTFWPCALPQAGEPADLPEEFQTAAAPAGGMLPAPDVFWAGVRALKARAVIIMGSAALKAVALPAPLPLMGQTLYRGCLVWVIRDVDFLLDQPQYYGATLEFLRQNLQRVIRA